MFFDEGIQYANNILWSLDESPPANYFIMLVKYSGFQAFASSDTAASHAGWEEETRYSQSARPAWSPGGSVDGRVTNANTVITLTPTETITVENIVVITNSTKGGTTGKLILATSGLGGPITFTAGMPIKIVLSISSEGQ